MTTSFAALLFRPEEVPDRALSQGFAVALGGWDVPAPHLTIAALPGIPGWSVAFYASGTPARRGDDELDHWCELFEDELSPPVAVLDAATELGRPVVTVFALVYSDDVLHDDGWRFSAGGFVRRFVREGEEGLEGGVEMPDSSDVNEISIDAPEEATDAELRAITERAARPHRGSTYLSTELGAPVLSALTAALFAPERRLSVRLIEPGAAAIVEEARRLNRVLRRVDGRGVFAPKAASGVVPSASYAAFAGSYDWADPADPQDLYRELAIGAIEGTLRFLREPEIATIGEEASWSAVAGRGLYPIGRLMGSALGGAAATPATLALAPDGEQLWLVRAGKVAPAGPTFGELLRYLSLGWSRRSDAEEDFIGALMLRARLRVEAG